MADMYRITSESIDIAEILRAIEDPATGGHALFLGTVRNEFEGRPSKGLFYEAYTELAEKEMRRIGQELKQEFDALHVAMVHRVGELGLTEVSVVIAVSAPHRGQAFAACQAGIDRVKQRAPIWKKERWADGMEHWHFDSPDDQLKTP